MLFLFHLYAKLFPFCGRKDPSPPKLPISFATDNVHEKYLTVAGNRYGNLPSGLQIGDVVVKVNGMNVATPTEIATVLRGISGKAEFTIKRGSIEKIFS